MKKQAFLLLLCAASLAFSGCGDDSPSPTPGATQPASPPANQGGSAAQPQAGAPSPQIAGATELTMPPPMEQREDVAPASWVMSSCEAPAPTKTNYSPVTTGETHSCAVTPAGSVYCWGRNLDGELGDGTSQIRGRPTPVKGLTGVVQASAGHYHTCAVTKAGEVWCWGRNTEGQVGSGAGAESLAAPVKVAACASQVASGEDFSCALRRDGEVICWGNGDDGRLGNGSTDSARTPAKVAGLTDVIDIAAGADHVCAATKTGEVWCWGSNGYKRLGSESAGSSSARPIQVEGISGAVQVAAGTYNSCAISKRGRLQCWGYNYYGQLGNGQTGTEATSASPVNTKSLRNVLHVDLAEEHSCAVTENGRAYCWGQDGYGNLGGEERGNRTEPQQVANLTDATHVALGDTFSCAATEAGGVYCWGGGHGYLLGVEDPEDPYHATEVIASLASYSAPAPQEYTFPAAGPVEVEPMVELSEGFACALRRNNGRPICWGNNASGNIGDGTSVARTDGVREVIGISDAVELDIGGSRVCIRRANGTVACWGWLSHFNGSQHYSSSRPVPIEGINDAQRILLGREGILCIQRASGAITCSDSYGRMSDVAGLTDVAQMDSGVGYVCAVQQNGQVWCWGRGGYGQLGNGSDRPSQTPVQVTGIADATFVATGNSHACALHRTGTVSCWGQNEDGRLGNGQSGSELTSTTPVAVPGLTDVISIDAGLNQTCALRRDGQTLCWGDNGFGQAGLTIPTGGSAPETIAVPTQIAAGTSPLFAQMGNPVSVHTDWHISCLLYQHGHLACWGTSSALGPGSLGGAFSRRAAVPTPLQGFQLGEVSAQ